MSIRTPDFLVFPRTSGLGIKVDDVAPAFPWADMIGDLKDRSPATAPVYSAYNGNMWAYKFPTAVGTKEMFIEFHIPHDYVPNTDLYIHAHWSQITVDTGGVAGVPGNVKWYFDLTYAKGHGVAGGTARGAFSSLITTSITQQASATQYGHMIAEVQLSAASPSASQLPTANIEVDGIILARIYRDASDAGDTLDQSPFLHFVDLHYQTTGIGTKQKAPDFYSA